MVPDPSDGAIGRGAAPGAPGIGPTWSSSAKDAVGTADSSSRVWFTVGHGVLNEVYWPRVDAPQVRDLGFIVADGSGWWSEVKRDAESDVRFVKPGVPAIIAVHRHERYVLTLRICADGHADVVRIEARLEDRRPAASQGRRTNPLRLYPLLAPHLGFSGLHNRAWVGDYKGRPMLFAQNGGSNLAVASDPAPLRESVGYVGVSDGWQDFSTNGRMAWTYDATDAGNVAGMLEVAPGGEAVQIALGFGARPEEAALQVTAALAGHFDVAWDEYVDEWDGFLRTCTPAPRER
ncbi:MAG: glucoamylase, partial [Chloroflexota bacterium]|nr:glucoamylase [Chloroflexota bacterium]